MSLINDYLSGYSGKLSLQNASSSDKNQKIKLDKQNFEDYAKAVNDGSINPDKEYLNLKKELKHLVKDSITKRKQYLGSAQYQASQEEELNNQLNLLAQE